MVIQNFTTQIDLCSTISPHRNLQRKETIYVGWDKPSEGWIKLNCDGACKGGGENSGCGGLLRNSDARWLKGYIRKIGVCDALHAEWRHSHFGAAYSQPFGFRLACPVSSYLEGG